MTSCDAVVGCGASGIAWADMDIRPRPSANADAARIFIGYFLSSRFSPRRGRFGLRKQHGSPVTPIDIAIGTTGGRPTSGDGANGDASGAAANPNAGANGAGANACASGAGASDGPNAPAPA
jgi:hypothetical protein